MGFLIFSIAAAFRAYQRAGVSVPYGVSYFLYMAAKYINKNRYEAVSVPYGVSYFLYPVFRKPHKYGANSAFSVGKHFYLDFMLFC